MTRLCSQLFDDGVAVPLHRKAAISTLISLIKRDSLRFVVLRLLGCVDGTSLLAPAESEDGPADHSREREQQHLGTE